MEGGTLGGTKLNLFVCVCVGGKGIIAGVAQFYEPLSLLEKPPRCSAYASNH